MGLHFAFVLETVLTMQGYFCYCWAVLTGHQGHFCLHTTTPESWTRVQKKLGGDTAGTAEPTDHRDIPYFMTSCSVHKAGGVHSE